MKKTARNYVGRATLVAVVAASAFVVAPRAAHADASCEAAMDAHFNWDANGPGNLIRFQKLQYVYVKDNGAWTMYSQGDVYWNGGAGGNQLLSSVSPLTQLFSDRQNNGQPFAINLADQTTITGISRDGVVTMHNNTWNFDSTFNATCSGNTLTARAGSDGTLVMTVVDASTPRFIVR